MYLSFVSMSRLKDSMKSLFIKTDARLTTVVSPFSHFMKFCGITHGAKIGGFFDSTKKIYQNLSIFNIDLQLVLYLS